MHAIAKKAFHWITGNRKFYYRRLGEIAPLVKGQRVLEIGSGKQVKGEEAYSAVHIFKEVAEFRQTDINPDFGHEVLDIKTMEIDGEYDLILCLNVLEHIYETELVVENLRRALKDGGRLVIAVPFAFPLHDEPHDYHRFTKYALTRVLEKFKSANIEVWGPKKMPYGHFAIAEK